MELTKEQIEKINKLSPKVWQVNEQGIFSEPFGVPNNEKRPVIYMRWETGGMSGGSCWEDSDPQPYISSHGKPKFEVLDLVIKELMPDISYLQYKDVEKLIKGTSETDYEYYGNCTDFDIEYIVLSELLELLETFKNK